MNYEPNTWQSGDVITSEKLNRIENALAAMAAAQDPLEINVSQSVDPETGKGVLTTDKTAEELFDAINAGKKVRVLSTLTYPVEEGTITVDVTYYVSVFAKKMVSDIGTFFAFGFVDVDSEDGVLGFVSGEHSADDTVVFTEV